MASIEIVEADLDRADHQQAVVELIDAYAADPMGNGRPLSAATRLELIPGLRLVPTTVIFLAYRERSAIGIAVCFRGFSTFAARPLINIHDLAVLPAQRGQGVGRRLLEAVEWKARDMGCCKLTLEVAEHNDRARRIYCEAGFEQALPAPGSGGALFMSKPLENDGKHGSTEARK
jgi:GNAT superfamily N-acetyltransferase